MALYDRILITGAHGMLGHALTDDLLRRGHNPIPLPRQSLDIADPAALESAFQSHRPTLLLNCAAHTKVDLCEQEPEKAESINGRAVGHLARLCSQHNTCLVHISTDFVFDGRSPRPYRTTDPTNPLSVYGRSKLSGEHQLQQNAPPRWLIARTAWVYGRHGQNFPRTIVQAARAHKPLNVVNDQHGAPTYAPDLSAAILDLLDTGAQGLWHITNAGQTTWRDFAVETLKQFAIDAPVGALTSADWQKLRPNTAPRPAYSVLDLTPLERQLSRPMRPWQEALADFHRAVEAAGEF